MQKATSGRTLISAWIETYKGGLTAKISHVALS